MRDENKAVYAASSSPAGSSLDHLESQSASAASEGHESGYSLHMPGYNAMTRGRHHLMDEGRGSHFSNDENHVSFAKCLLLVFEKAINVQF